MANCAVCWESIHCGYGHSSLDLCRDCFQTNSKYFVSRGDEQPEVSEEVGNALSELHGCLRNFENRISQISSLYGSLEAMMREVRVMRSDMVPREAVENLISRIRMLESSGGGVLMSDPEEYSDSDIGHTGYTTGCTESDEDEVSD